jgi:hypothetical protein
MRREDCTYCAELLEAYNAAARAGANREALRTLAKYDAHFAEAHRRGRHS